MVKMDGCYGNLYPTRKMVLNCSVCGSYIVLAVESGGEWISLVGDVTPSGDPLQDFMDEHYVSHRFANDTLQLVIEDIEE